MIKFEELVSGNTYKCTISKAYAAAEDKPAWAGKTVNLKFTGLVFRSLKEKDKLLFYEADVEPMEVINELD